MRTPHSGCASRAAHNLSGVSAYSHRVPPFSFSRSPSTTLATSIVVSAFVPRGTRSCESARAILAHVEKPALHAAPPRHQRVASSMRAFRRGASHRIVARCNQRAAFHNDALSWLALVAIFLFRCSRDIGQPITYYVLRSHAYPRLHRARIFHVASILSGQSSAFLRLQNRCSVNLRLTRKYQDIVTR